MLPKTDTYFVVDPVIVKTDLLINTLLYLLLQLKRGVY